ncbi:MAG: hypothetical protein CL840_17540 [Crocinitomicaceae bacterium]|nr:hypothetical protein [Crocinitomicaceae bacterium]|tara:strand:- start:11393 stop:11935 length:543 start_codon:yes stop_codon:yes gene_type:complete
MKVVKDNKQTKKRNDQIEKGLQSSNSTEILRAIKMLRKDGRAEHITLIIQALNKSESDEVSNEIIKFLNDLKIDLALPPIIEALNNEELESVHVFLLQAIWNSRLDATPYLEDLVNLATKSDYLTCLEVLTIVENLPTRPEDEVIAALNTQLKDAVIDNEESRNLLLSMIEVLNDHMIGG